MSKNLDLLQADLMHNAGFPEECVACEAGLVPCAALFIEEEDLGG